MLIRSFEVVFGGGEMDRSCHLMSQRFEGERGRRREGFPAHDLQLPEILFSKTDRKTDLGRRRRRGLAGVRADVAQRERDALDGEMLRDIADDAVEQIAEAVRFEGGARNL